MKRKAKILTIVLFLCFSIFSTACGEVDNGFSSEKGSSNFSDLKNVCTVTFVQAGEENCIYQVEEGTIFNLEDYPLPKSKVGYTVTWEDIALEKVVEDVQINAILTPNEYEIRYYLQKNQTRPYHTQSVVYDAEYILLNTVNIEGKIFVGWKNKQTEEAFVGGVWNATKDIELVAVWGNTANGSGWSPFA